MDEESGYQQLVETLDGRMERALRNAVETMKQACAQAERDIADDLVNGETVSRVQQSLAWGHANASTSIASAISAMSEKIELSNLSRGSGASADPDLP